VLLRLPGGSPDARQPAVNRRAQLGGVYAGHGQRPGPGHHGHHSARARLRSSPTWAIDHTQKAAKGDQYAARHDGFTFFRSATGSQACCGEASGFGPDHPNVPLPGKNGPGGGRIGAVLLSPLIRPGTVSTVNYNHYSLLRTVEDIFGLPHLGDAAMPQVRSFGPDVFG
jgi:hypothetical protein